MISEKVGSLVICFLIGFEGGFSWLTLFCAGAYLAVQLKKAFSQ